MRVAGSLRGPGFDSRRLHSASQALPAGPRFFCWEGRDPPRRAGRAGDSSPPPAAGKSGARLSLAAVFRGSWLRHFARACSLDEGLGSWLRHIARACLLGTCFKLLRNFCGSSLGDIAEELLARASGKYLGNKEHLRFLWLACSAEWELRTMRDTTGPFIPRSHDRRFPLFLVACVYALALVASALQTFDVFQRGGDAYRVGDWLINYAGGFVRRGLFGHVLLAEGKLFPGTLLPLVLIIQLGLYANLLWLGFGLLKAHLPRRSTMLLLALSPATFLFESLNAQSFRKELLALVLLAGYCRAIQLSEQGSDRRVKRWLWSLSVAIPLLVLCHETSLLLIPYVFLATISFGWRSSFFKPSVVLTGLSLSAFLAALFNTGDQETVARIVASLDGLVPETSLSTQGRHGAILALRYSSSDALVDLRSRIMSDDYDYPKKYGAILLLTGVGFFLNRDYLRPLLKAHLAKLVLLSAFFATVLLLSLAKDWGRFVYLNATALTLVLLTQPVMERASSGAKNRTVILLSLVYALSWRVPISKPSLELGAARQFLLGG